MRVRNVRRVAVIGGGPAGAAVAKYLLAEKCFSQIDIYEQRSALAGVWNYTPENDSRGAFAIPQTDPRQPLDKPIWRHAPGHGHASKQATFVSPLYDRLEANLPKSLMQHSDTPFPDEEQLFPTHASITSYLEKYAEEVKHLVKFEHQVMSIRKNKTWQLSALDLVSKTPSTEDYDAVVVASGHYNIPFIPDKPGLQEWAKRYPGVVTHAKLYRRPEDYRGKKVLIIGTGPSGSDIAYQIAQYSASPLLVSTRSGPFSTPHDNYQKYLGGIEEFLPSSSEHPRAIRFADDHVEDCIDHVIFCTGYLYSYPFLPDDLPLPIITDGQRVNNVYQHIFYTADPTLTFLTLPWNIVPFPVAEAQSAVVARVYAGRLDLPSQQEIEQWAQSIIRQRGNGKAFHQLPPPNDINYINDLHDWAEEADGEPRGKLAPYWGGRHQWMRYNVGRFKKAFMNRGEDRHNVKTLEELGFKYEEAVR